MWSPKCVFSFRVRVNIYYDNHDYDDKDRHGVIVKVMESMIVREIDMKMLTSIEKHCGVGGWCLEWLHPPPKGFKVREKEERDRHDNREKD